jgi:predicted ATPase/DNA-binding winged helix-turn-helix (wHTH) protein
VSETSTNLVYACDRWEIDIGRREFRSSGIPVPLGSRAFEIVKVLVETTGLVTGDHLMEQVWSGVTVGEGTIRVHISAVRKALGQDRALLKTVPGRGYRLLGDWKPKQRAATAALVYSPLTRTSGAPAASNFAPVTKRLIGRTAAAQYVRDLVSAYRMVTLTGAGGIGKTSLAIEAVRQLLPDFEDGGWIVELASLSDPDLVPSAVAGTLGLSLGGEVSAESVAHTIGEKNLLLVLDNCEHVIEAAANLAEALTRLCPRTAIVATSREVLGVGGESVYRVPPLDVPEVGREDPEQVLYCGAVELLIERTRALDPDYSPSLGDLPSLAAICRRLDGIPLAIEFAAARAATIGLSQVAAGLGDCFRLLTRGRRTALRRHQTLRAALDWSYELLPPDEQRLLRRLAIFLGGFTLEAAKAVGAHEVAGDVIVDGISSLVAKSLLMTDELASTRRWRLLETIRAYALEKLIESGEELAMARRHAEYFRRLIMPSTTEPVLPLTVEDMLRYGREIDNVRAALDWSFSSDGDAAVGVTLAAAFAPVWINLSLLVECRARAEHALRILRPDLQLTRAMELRLLMALGVALTLTLGSIEQTREVIARARQLAFDIDDREALLRMLWAQFSMEMNLGEHRTALGSARQFVELARRQRDDALTLVGERFIGTSMFRAGELNAARSCLERMVKHYVAPPSGHHTVLFHHGQRAIARANLAHVLSLQGYLDWAREQVRLSLEEADDADEVTFCWVLHNGAIPIALMTGDLAAADKATATMNALATRLDAALWKILGRCWEGKLFILRREFAQGTALLREALELREQKGWQGTVEFAGDLACGLAGLERFDEAIATLDGALDRAESNGGSWCQSEFIRIKGEVLLQRGAQNEALAEDCFQAAAQLAHAQCALYWELGAALSVARLRVSQGRHHEARLPLASVYDRFTEGFATADLQAARTLLQELPP